MQFTYLPIDEFKIKVAEIAWEKCLKNPDYGLMHTLDDNFKTKMYNNLGMSVHVVVINLSALSSPDYSEKRASYLTGFKDAQEMYTNLLGDDADLKQPDVISVYVSSIHYGSIAHAMLGLQKNHRILCTIEEASAERIKPFNGAFPIGEYDARN